MSAHARARARRLAAARPRPKPVHWPVELPIRVVAPGTFDEHTVPTASVWLTSRLVERWEVRPGEDRWNPRRHPLARHVEVMHRDPGVAMWELGDRPAHWTWEAMHADPSGRWPRELVPVVAAAGDAGHWMVVPAIASDDPDEEDPDGSLP